MYKKVVLLIFLSIFVPSPYSYGKELRARIVIEYFWDHNFCPAPTWITSGTTHYTAIYDGRLQELKEKEGFRYANPNFNISYGISGNFKASYDKNIFTIYKDENQNIFSTTEVKENGQDSRQYNFLPDVQSNPYPILRVKFLDKNKARYRLDIYTPDLQHNHKSVITMPGHIEKVQEERTRNITELTSIFLPPPSGLAEGGYDTNKGIISGNKIWDYDLREFGQGHGYTKLTWYIGPEPPEVTIEPKDSSIYEDWMPKGGEDSNTLTFKIASKPEAYIEVELSGVSKEKGECLNYPPSDVAKESYDLRFDTDENPELEIDQSGQKATSRNKAGSLQVVVKSSDYGSFGRLKAVAILDKGGPNEVRFPAVFKDKNTADIPIPKDDNSNNIADVWEKEEGVEGYLSTSDEDPEPAWQKENGDGFSLYEEYRGFYVKNQHQRLSPRGKELFIYDPDGLAGRSFFEKASGIKAYYINPDQMNGTGSSKDMKRCVNFNAGFSTISPQFGLHVVKVDGILRSPEGHILNGEIIKEEGWPGSPKTVQIVKIYPDATKRCINKTYEENANKIKFCLAKCGIKDIENYIREIVDELINHTTTHELGHAVGIQHHKSFVNYRFRSVLRASGGNPLCVMRYLWDEYQDPEKKGVVYIVNYFLLYLKNPSFRPRGFCKNPDNCFGQIDVSD